MSLVNFTTREITCKIVYYGPGRSGKTTNLQYMYSQVPADRKGRMVSLATQTDRTLFFDFLPLDLGTISGFTTKFQLYTVPGQVYYNATRKLVLQGADGVVFVADSQLRQLDENIESLQNLHANILEHGVDVAHAADGAPVQQAGPAARAHPHRRRSSTTRSTSAALPTFPADALHGAGRVRDAQGHRRRGAAAAERRRRRGAADLSVDLNPRFRFESFVVGAGNRLAAAAARTVAESPGAGLQPAVHLRQVGARQDAPAPGRRLPRAGAAADAARGVPHARGVRRALPRRRGRRARSTRSAAARWRRDLLLLDDVQFLAEHREMQAELLRLTEAHAGGGAADRADQRPAAGRDRRPRRAAGRRGSRAACWWTSPRPTSRRALAILRRKVEERGRGDAGAGVLETVARGRRRRTCAS